MSENSMRPFQFLGSPYLARNRLLDAMAANWKEGRNALFSGQIAAHFKTVDAALYRSAVAAENEYRRNPQNRDLIFWRWIYGQGTVPVLYWQNRRFGYDDQVILLLESGTDMEFNRVLALLMQQKLFSLYAKSDGMPASVIENVKYVEKCYNREKSGYHRPKTGRLLSMILSQRKKYTFDSENFDDVQAFAAHLQMLAENSPARLQSRIRPLFLDDCNLDPVFEGWLLNQGYRHEISLWNDRYQASADLASLS